MPVDRVLVITYLFPPSGGVGVSRFVSYARYLPDHNCEPYILTVRNPATPLYDPDLAKKVPPETRVFRAFNPEIPYGLRDRLWKKVVTVPGASTKPTTGGWRASIKGLIQRVFSPDVQVVWVPFAIRAARRIIARHKITTVILNLPPYSCLYIGVAVKRHYPGVKLILDFRDEWIDNYLTKFDSAANSHKLRLALDLERRAVESADFVSAVTQSQLDQIHRRYPDQPESKFLYVPNGYDPTVYANFHARRAPGGKLVITYFGTVYANSVYSPIKYYLDTVDDLPEEVRSRIESRFIGRVAREAAYFFESRKHAIRQYGFMSREAALPYLEETGYNLIVSGNPTTHAGKLFDYLGMGKPLLALCPVEGEMAKVIRETNIGWCVDPEDRPAIRELLMFAVERFDDNKAEWFPNWDAIREYEWPNLVGRLARLAGMGGNT